MITREFDYSSETKDEIGAIQMHLYPPTEHADGDWTCQLELLFPNEKIEKEITGVDGLQAFLLAIKIAKTLLEVHAKTHKVKITWLEMDDLGLGHS